MIVRCYGQLRQLLKQDSVAIRGHPGTLGELIEQLAEEHDQQLREELLDEAGNIDYAYAVFINGQRAFRRDAVLGVGDEVTITSMITGGREVGF